MVIRRILVSLFCSATLLTVAGSPAMHAPAGEQDEIEGRAPTHEELRRDMREISMAIRTDWELV